MTPTAGLDPARIKALYEVDAERYLRSLPLEHFMEDPAQATQRKITLESFDLIHAARPDVQCFNELLIQYPVPEEDTSRPGRVVPDNMVVVHPTLLDVGGSFMLPLQPVGPLLVMEYVSKGSVRKDYHANMGRYEQDVKVPYYLLFYPDNDELTLFRLNPGGYAAVRPDEAGRLAIPELELEVGLLGGWARYWFRGELLPLPAEWQGEMDAVRAELAAERTARRAAEQRADVAEAEIARLRALLAERGG